MKSKKNLLTVSAIVMFLITSAAYGQGNNGDINWHIDPNVKTCPMVIDPSLTQEQWKRYTRQVGITGTETTSKVDLRKERLMATQGFAGISYSFWRINLAIEYNISDVNTFSFLIGFQSYKNKH